MSGAALLICGMSGRLTILKEALIDVGWDIKDIMDPRAAIEILKSETFDAVFCDERLRGASPAGLLVWTHRLIPDMPFYLFSNTQDKSRFKLSGQPTSILHFPPVIAQLPTPTGAKSPEKTAVDDTTPLSGNTSVVPIADVIEMMGISNQSGVIEFDFGQKGFIAIKEGKMEHALYLRQGQAITGLQALSRIIQLEEAEFQVKAYEASSVSSINLPASKAMTEAARLADESERSQNIISLIQQSCPSLTGMAIGYALASHPSEGMGDSLNLFNRAKRLVEAQQDVLGGKIKTVFLSTDKEAIALCHFGKGNMIVASAPSNHKDKLFSAVEQTLTMIASFN